MHFTTKSASMALSALALAGCASFFPSIGPTRHGIEHQEAEASIPPIPVIDVNEDVTRRLVARRTRLLFSEVLSTRPDQLLPMGKGDFLTVTIWEAAPATLFGSVQLDPRGIPVMGKANQPEVLVLQSRNLSSSVTVVGEVTTSTRVPLTATHERLLDALAIAAGVRQPVNKTTIQLTRGDAVHSLPLETIIKDPRQNIALQPGDVVTALYQPLSFTALGATGKNEEISFETQGITLAQALARSGGLIDQRSNPKGVFIFRLEPKSRQAPNGPAPPATAEGLIPIIYRVDLRDPRSLFWIQSFPVQDKDVLYVSNAPVWELQKFMNLLFTLAYPVQTGLQLR